MTRDRGDADTLDDHKLLWARSGPSAPDVQVDPQLMRINCLVLQLRGADSYLESRFDEMKGGWNFGLNFPTSP